MTLHMCRKEKGSNWLVAAGASVLVGTGSAWIQPAWASGGGGGGAGETGTATHQHLDGQFSHNRYYYDRGYAVHTLSTGGVEKRIGPAGERYYFSAGNWFRWRGDWYRCWGGAWVAVDAPIGVSVSALPPHYTTILRSGTAYFYANETYYVWDAERKEYQVVAPPGKVE